MRPYHDHTHSAVLILYLILIVSCRRLWFGGVLCCAYFDVVCIRTGVIDYPWTTYIVAWHPEVTGTRRARRVCS
jgi:hypothetical protein